MLAIDGLNKWAWHIIISRDYNWQPFFVGQKKNEINRVTLISQHSNEVFENDKQLVNIDFKHIFGFSR